MADLPPIDYPGDVWAVGQRRRPDGSFPPPGGGGGIPGDDGGVHQDEVDPDPDDPPWSPPHPCDDPETALPWNADAAAAAAAAAMMAKAASLGSSFTDRGVWSPSLSWRGQLSPDDAHLGRGPSRGWRDT